MPGPPPGHGAKHPGTRARRNKSSTAAELPVLGAEDRAQIEVPELPAERLWDPRTSDFWVNAWQSPMRLEWDPGDMHKLLMLAYLLDEFYAIADDQEMSRRFKASSMSTLASSVLSLGARLGLDPYARRSLQWLLVRTEQAEAETARTRQKTARSKTPARRKRKGLGALE